MRKKLTKPFLEELKKNVTVKDDLSNQKLSSDPAERTRQLDYQAQASENLGTGGTNNG